jgi:hypothetical protein
LKNTEGRQIAENVLNGDRGAGCGVVHPTLKWDEVETLGITVTVHLTKYVALVDGRGN